MISVIIPKFEDDLYLIRCLSAIKRQTYKDIEILVVGRKCEQDIINKYNLRNITIFEKDKCNGLNKAITLANGEYIFFCSVSSVLSPNTLDELLKEQERGFAYADVYVSESNTFVNKEQVMSCYGKLFNRAIIDNNKICFEDESFMSECLFVANYMSFMKNIHAITHISIYDTKYTSVCTQSDISISISAWRNCLQNINKAQSKVNYFVSKALSKIILENMVCSDEFINMVKETVPSNYMISYAVLSPVLNVLWNNAKTNNDESLFERFKEYLVAYEKEAVLDLMLQACGLKRDYYKYIKNNNINECLFLIEEIEKLSKQKSELTDMVGAIMNGASSGLCKINGNWYYYSNGRLDNSFCGLVRNEYGWWYVSNGTIDYDYVGLCKNAYGWWYVSNGTINKKYTGLAMNSDGVWMYMTNGANDKKYAGLVKTDNGYRYISKGVIDREYTGLVKCETGKWLYVSNGTVNTQFMGLARNAYGWWYVENGTINLKYNGFAKNNLGWCEVVNGKAKTETVVDIFKILKEEPVRETIKEPVKEPESYTIMEDAANVSIGYYKDGKLGFKTILKSIGAWGKYKFKR